MGRLYWLKLKRDFFKRHDMVILNAAEKGSELVLIFLKLMAESLDHDGRLRFSDSVPYTPQYLSYVVGTDEKTMEYALETYKSLELIELLEDGTLYIPMVKDVTISQEDNPNANRQRRYRDAKRMEKEVPRYGGVMDTLLEVTGCVTKDNESIEYRDKSIEYRDKIDNTSNEVLSKEKINKREKRFVKPTVEEIKAYCEERGNGIDAERFYDFYESKDWYVGKNRMHDFKACIRNWERREKKDNVQAGYITDGKGYKYMVNDETVKEADDPLEDMNSILGGDL